jgi:hypothetical protein
MSSSRNIGKPLAPSIDEACEPRTLGRADPPSLNKRKIDKPPAPNSDSTSRLSAADGRQPAEESASPGDMPLVLAPMNDLLGLAITEEIEDAFLMHEATGLGSWAAGSAPFMPKLVAAIEDLATTRECDASPDCITICVDEDDAGRRSRVCFEQELIARGFEVRLIRASPWK